MGMLRSLASGPPRKANGKIDFAPKRHHGFQLFLWLCGFIFPPLAVAVRFGIGKDFFICLVLTICGWFPGHGYNFFVQNIRDNSGRSRTPKWAIRYGLVDQSDAKKLAKSRVWTGRYNDQMPTRTMYDENGNEVVYQSDHRYEDGDNSPVRNRRRQDSTLIEPDRYHNGSNGSGMSRDNSDPYSLRRTSTANSFASNSGTSARNAAKNKSKTRAFLGRGKSSTSNRHAKTDEVMGASEYNDPSAARRNGVGYHGGFDGTDSNSFNSSLEDDLRRGGHRSGMGGRGGYDDEGPEDADAAYRPSKSSAASRGYGSSAATSDRQTGRVANDGLDHTF